MASPLSAWHAALANSAAPRTAEQRLRHLLQGPAGEALAAVAESSRPIVAAILAGSRLLGAQLEAHPEWIPWITDPETLRHPRRKQGLQRDADVWVQTALRGGDEEAALAGLHALRVRELFRIGARDLARLGALPELLREISQAAEVFLDALLRMLWHRLSRRFGTPWHREADGRWSPTEFSVLGLGKLGGEELNYSSDVDLLFVYTEEGGTFGHPPGRRGPAKPRLTNHQFFRRLGEALIHEGTRRGVAAGGLRLDLRLRPEGDAGPLARSLASYETYYAAWGQTWERLMLLKARPVAGSAALAGEFLETIQPFRYPRSLDETVGQEIAELKARIEREAGRATPLEDNVKLGRGGIRDVEFLVQTHQLLEAGRNPFLQTPSTLDALARLGAYRSLGRSEVATLGSAYQFLREVEHRLQLDEFHQTHSLPTAADARERLARQMNCRNATAFRRRLRAHQRRVRTQFERRFGVVPRTRPRDALPGDFTTDAAAWATFLHAHGFRDAERGRRLLREFVEGPGFIHVSPRTRRMGRDLLPRLLELCPRPTDSAPRYAREFVLSDPDRVVTRLDAYVQAYGPRASLYELWAARPHVFLHLLKLFDRSEYLAERALQSPGDVDELESGGYLGRRKDADGLLAELRHGAADADQPRWLRRYATTERLRLGLRHLQGLVTAEEANTELSALADACLAYALEIACRRHRLKQPPFAIVALGKLGGRELDDGSDLDVIFVAPNASPRLASAQRIAAEVLDLLGARTPDGTGFVVDARLRPDGGQGRLVNTLAAHEEYYRHRAQLWEIQALTRARAITGAPSVGEGFESLARVLTNFSAPSLPLAAFGPEWKSGIARMRTRIEQERTPTGQEALAFKTGAGGLADVEFLAQTLAMAGGWFEPNTRRSLLLAQERGALGAAETKRLLADFTQLRRVESILRRWSFVGESVLPADPAAQDRVAIRCGYRNGTSLRAAMDGWRRRVREIYRRRME